MACFCLTLYFLSAIALLPVGGKIAERHRLRYRTGTLICGFGSIVGLAGLCVFVTVRDEFFD